MSSRLFLISCFFLFFLVYSCSFPPSFTSRILSFVSPPDYFCHFSQLPPPQTGPHPIHSTLHPPRFQPQQQKSAMQATHLKPTQCQISAEEPKPRVSTQSPHPPHFSFIETSRRPHTIRTPIPKDLSPSYSDIVLRTLTISSALSSVSLFNVMLQGFIRFISRPSTTFIFCSAMGVL